MRKMTILLCVLCCINLSSCNTGKYEGNYVQIVDNKGNTSYNIVYGDVGKQCLQEIEAFANNLNKKCKSDIEVYPESQPETLYEIIIGDALTRLDSVLNKDLVTPTGFKIVETGNKILLCASSSDAIIKGLDTLYDNIVKYDYRNWGIMQSINIGGDAYMDTFVPKLYKSVEKENEYYNCGDGFYEISYNDSTSQDYQDYCALLEKEGFNKLFDNSIGENLFVTYTKEDALANLSYFPSDKKTALVYGKKVFEPSLVDTSTKVVEPTITQIGRKGASQSSPGLSIVCQLIDGSYIIVDGGPVDEEDKEELYNYLKNNNPNEEKPQITWMFTHAHHDHIGLAISFLEEYHDKIDVNLFCYNFPDFNEIVITQEPAERVEKSKELIGSFNEIHEKYYNDVPKYIFHSGDKFVLPGCEIEILSTHESFYPNETPWINHTSSAWTIEMNNTKMLILGDAEQTVCEWMAKTYKEELKCDILQVTHHGLNGGSIEMYSFVDPSICFWPIDNNRFENEEMCLGTKWGFEYNAWLRNDAIRKRTHYAASNTTTLKL